MCIIISKEKGVKLPSKKTLKTCFEHNPDGAGLMYVKNNQVIIDKGYMKFEDFYKRIKGLKREFNSDLTDKALVMHFRIGTHGKNDKETTHPFPITSSVEELRKTKTTTNVGVAHNGIISNYGYYELLSDTQAFIKDFISVFRELDKKFYKNKSVMKLIESKAASKLCFLDNKENIYYIGAFVEDNGVKYSNTSYKPYVYFSGGMFDDYYLPSTSKYSTYNVKSKVYEEKEKTLEGILEEHESYIVLDEEDMYELDGVIYGVGLGEKLLIDTETDNLYEYFNGKLSLVGTNVALVSYEDLMRMSGTEVLA